jgi:hypothetical protein
MHLLNRSTIAVGVSDVFEHHESIGDVLVRHAEVILVFDAEQNDGIAQFALFFR